MEEWGGGERGDMCDIYPGPHAPTEVKFMAYGHRLSTLGATGCN